MQDFWIIAVVSLLAMSAGVLGCFLMLRKMSMLTDAIAHGILPGIVIAYLLSGTKSNFLILLVASLFGLITTILIGKLEKKLKNRSDAATGIGFTFFFAVGIILVTLFAEQADLDTECVLFGEMLYIPFETIEVGKWEVPQSFMITFLVFVLVTCFVVVSYRPLSLICFDETYAFVIGISVGLWNYALISLVSVLTVASFEILGSVLVIALFVFPPATAFLLSKKLQAILFLSLIISVLSVVLGYYFSVWQEGSSAASIVVVQGVIFALVLGYNKLVKKQI